MIASSKLLLKLFRHKLAAVRRTGAAEPRAVNESDFQPSTAALSHEPGGNTVAAAQSLLAAWEEEDRLRTAAKASLPRRPSGSKSTRH